MLKTAPPEFIKSQKTHFHFLDSFRGIAAISVVFYHIYIQSEFAVSPLLGILPKPISYILFEQTFGVAIFFVLSGFVIAYSMRNARMDWSYFSNFMVRRLIRLTPPYYAAITFALLLGLADSVIRGDAFNWPDPLVMLANALYLEDILGVQHIIEVAWTLCIEMQFYIVFCALLFLAHRLESIFKLRNALVIVFVPTGLFAVLWPLGIILEDERPQYFMPVWYSFLVGALAYWAWSKRVHIGWLYLYLFVIVLGGSLNSDSFVVAVGMTALTIFAVAKANRLETVMNWRWLQFLGLISYSLYLTHASVISAVTFVMGKILGEATVFTSCISVVAILGASIILATLMWWLFERPSIVWSRKSKLSTAPVG